MSIHRLLSNCQYLYKYKKFTINCFKQRKTTVRHVNIVLSLLHLSYMYYKNIASSKIKKAVPVLTVM